MKTRLIAALCTSCFACSTALVVNHKQPAAGEALLQLRSQSEEVAAELANQSPAQVAAGQHWSPEILSYLRYLEDLEASPGFQIFIETSRARTAANGSVLFVVLSDSGYYANRLKWISETWGQDLPSSQLLAIGDANKRAADTTMRVEPTRCPAHTHDGACCKMAEAIITAHQLLQQQPSFGWAYVVDDDAYVRPAALEKRLKSMDPKGENQRGTLAAIPGCQTKQCPKGFCGGGGAGFSREALATLVGDSPTTFLKQHMKTCQRCEMWGDVTVGTQADAHDISVWNPYGLNGWLMDKRTFDSVLEGHPPGVFPQEGPVEPLMYHYIRAEGQMQFLHQLFQNQSKPQLVHQTLSAAALAAQQAQEVKDMANAACATYQGNKVCTSDPRAVPWGSM